MLCYVLLCEVGRDPFPRLQLDGLLDGRADVLEAGIDASFLHEPECCAERLGAVKELSSSHHNSKTIFFALYSCYGNLI